MITKGLKLSIFSNGQQPEAFEVVEHIRFDRSKDYLYIDMDVIKFHSSNIEKEVRLVTDLHIDDLINALRYLKTKMKGQ